MMLGVSKPSGMIRFTEKHDIVGRTTTHKGFCMSLIHNIYNILNTYIIYIYIYILATSNGLKA